MGGNMASHNAPAGPLGGWFGTIGCFVGFALGWDFGELPGAIVGLFIGGYIGIAIEHIVWKLLIIGGAILVYLVRNELLGAIIESLNT
jgi:hypothetical protein